MKRFRMLAAGAALLVSLGISGSAKAQMFVPGGGVAYGGFYGTGVGFAAPYGYGYGYNPYYGGYGSGYGRRYYSNPGYYGSYLTPPMTVNTMGSLIGTIQRNTGRRRGGWQANW